MKIRVPATFAIACVLLAASGSARAQTSVAPKGDAIDFLEKNLLSVRLTFFSGGLFSGPYVVRAGKELSVGVFGGDARKVFAGVPGALDAMSTFRTLRITGGIFSLVGIGVLLADIILLIVKHDSVYDSSFAGSVRPLYWGLVAGGAAVGFVGTILMAASLPYLSDAVGTYNRAIFERARRTSARGPSIPRGFQASLRFSF